MNITLIPTKQQISITPPARPKKITGTRFGSVLGLNTWNTPFKEWCAITRVYEEPFEGNKYTEAGKHIEPKVAEYMKKRYFLTDLQTPTDVFGKDYFKKTYGNFFKDKIFGGMWDFKGDDYVVEVKTSSRPQDWEDEPPIYYLLQALLYAYLLEVDTVYLTVSFLEPVDYDNPDYFEVSPSNTKVYEYSLSNDFPNFENDYIYPARKWWEEHVLTGISPKFTEKDDLIIKELQTNYCTPDSDEDLQNLLKELETLNEFVDNIYTRYDLYNVEKQIKTKKDLVKDYLSHELTEDKNKAVIATRSYRYELSETTSMKIDEKKLKADGLFQQYEVEKKTTRFTVKKIKKDEE